MAQSFTVKVRDINYRIVEVSSAMEAAGKGLSMFIDEFSMDEIPVVVSVLEIFPFSSSGNQKMERKEKLILSPIILADLGFHKESAVLIKRLEKL